MKLPTVGIPAYPEEIEVWWRDQAVRSRPEEGEAKTFGRLRGEIVRQSDLFNKERDFSPRSYGARDVSLLAYGNFFFPRTWTHLAHVLAEMIHFRGWTPPRKGPLRLLDLGCGTGAAGLSALRFLRTEDVSNPIRLRAVDYSGKSLDYLRRLHADLSRLWPDSTLKTERRDLREALDLRPKDRHDLVLLSSSFNEFVPAEDVGAAASTLASLGQLLKPGGLLLVLEPALRVTAERLHLAAAQVAAGGELHLHAPYFNGLPCPMAAEGSKHHSHEVRPWKAPATAQTLNAPLKLNLRDLKFSFIALSPKPPAPFPSGPDVLRLVSPMSKKKGHYRFVGIATDGKEYACEIQTRDLPTSERKTLERLNRGDVLRLNAPQPIGQENRLRLASIEDLEPLFSPALVQTD